MSSNRITNPQYHMTPSSPPKDLKEMVNGNGTNPFEEKTRQMRFFTIRKKGILGRSGLSLLLETIMVVKKSFKMKDIREKLELPGKSKLWVNGRQGNFARLHISSLFDPKYKRVIVSETVPDIKLMLEYHYCSEKGTGLKKAEMFQRESHEMQVQIKKKHDTLERLGHEIDQLTKKLNSLKEEEENKKKLEEKKK